MEELKVINKLGKIEFNYKEVKAGLEKILEEYQGAVFCDESIQVAKSIVAELRKQQSAFDKRRIEVKKEYLKPFDEFEVKAKELIGLYNTPISFIDDQIKGYTERKKAEKKIKIIATYQQFIGDLEEYLPLNKIYNEKWENQSVNMKSVQEDLVQTIESVGRAIETIKAMNSDCVDKVLTQFKADLSLSNAITTITTYEQQKRDIQARIEEQQRKDRESAAENERLARERELDRERERVREDERKKIHEEERQRELIREEERQRAQAEQSAKEQAERDAMAIQKAENIVDEVVVIYSIRGTSQELMQIEMYMDSIGIEYTK